MSEKSAIASKTIWTNAALAAAVAVVQSIAPTVTAFIGPEGIAGLIALWNIGLRFLSKDKITKLV